jgi:maltose-binding protein MalE
MKKTLMSFVFVLSVLIIPCGLFAEQETETVTKTETVGTISEVSPDTIVIQTQTSKSPLEYIYTKTTTYVDETGTPVTIETVKSGQPVTIYYSLEDGRMIANKVVVHKSTTTKTTN